MPLAVYAQRNDPAASYDTALIALLEGRGWTVQVETGDLSHIDWSGVDLLIVGAPGTEYISHTNSGDLDSYPVHITSLCRYTSRVSLGLSGSSGSTSVSTFLRQDGDDRAVHAQFDLVADGASVSCHRINSLASGVVMHYAHDGMSTDAGIAEGESDGYRRTHFGFHYLDDATPEAEAIFLNYSVGPEETLLDAVIRPLHVLAATVAEARASLPVAVGALSALAVPVQEARAHLPGAIGDLSVKAFHDWTVAIDPRTTQVFYALELDDGILDPVRLPMASWQATLQLDRSSFLQAVIPAADQVMDVVTARPDAVMRIYRGARFLSGRTQEIELAAVPVQTPRFSEGPTNSTLTLSGHSKIDWQPGGGPVPDVSYWPLDEESGDQAEDEASGHTATVVNDPANATPSPDGKFGWCRDFGAADDGSSHLNLWSGEEDPAGELNQWTVSAWIRRDDTASASFLPEAWAIGEWGSANQMDVYFEQDGSEISIAARDETGSTVVDFGYAAEFWGTGWHLIVVTAAGGRTRLYVDGQFVGEASESVAINPRRPDATFGSSGGGDSYCDLMADDLRIYSKALNDAEISVLWNNGDGTLPAADEESAARVMTAVRSLTSDPGIRVRCNIDWYLRPGQEATARGKTFTVAYLNYYVTSEDEYMDVGERRL